MTGSANCDMVSEGRRDFCGAKLIGVLISHCTLRNDNRLALCKLAEKFAVRHFVESSDMVDDCIRKVTSPELYG